MAILVPRVSVLVANYNSGRFGAEAVRSALDQSWTDLEVVVVDDGSADDSAAAIEAMGSTKVRVIRQANAGPSRALNRGLAECRGEFVALLDHDDVWAPGKLQLQMEAFGRNPALDLSFTWSRLIDDHGKPSGLASSRWRGPLSFAQMMADFVIGNTSSVVLRRSAIDTVGGFDPAFRLYYDMDLFLRVAALREGNCESVAEDLTFYRRHALQISADWRDMAGEWPRLLAKFAGSAPAAVLRTGNANMGRYFCFLAYEKRDFARAALLWLRCIRLAPGALFTDARNVKMGAACLAGLLLPRRLHLRLEEAGARRHTG